MSRWIGWLQARILMRPWVMRVLHVFAPGAVGGLERVAQLLALGQARSGEEVHAAPVLDPATENHPFVEQLATGGVTVHPVVVPGRQYWLQRTTRESPWLRLVAQSVI